MQREIAVNHLVVGVAQDAAFGIDEARIGEILRHALPPVVLDPAGAWHARLRLVLRWMRQGMWPITCIAIRPSALASIRFCAGATKSSPASRPSSIVPARISRIPVWIEVFSVGQGGPCHAHHMAGRRDGGEIVSGSRE
jgi:hypothetical protein